MQLIAALYMQRLTWERGVKDISNHKTQSPVITIQPLNKKSSQFANCNHNSIVFAPRSQLQDHSCRTPGYNSDS